MAPIVLDVAQVVEEISGARNGAEGDEREDHVGDLGRLVELLREYEPGEDEDVLDPLAGTHRDEERERLRAGAGRRGRFRNQLRRGRPLLGGAFHRLKVRAEKRPQPGGGCQPPPSRTALAVKAKSRAPVLAFCAPLARLSPPFSADGRCWST